MSTRTTPQTPAPPETAPSTPSSPPPRGPITQPRLGPLGWARWAWRQLTSMRTALFLLLLLSVGAVPGSIFPQRSIDAVKVTDYIVAHATSGPILDRLGFFDVYASPWFSAIYLLLVVSLIGCIVPRSRIHWHTLRSKPPRAPKRLERLDEHVTFTYAGEPAQVLEAARKLLRRQRFRVVVNADDSVSAENGYLRETGNLVFHIAICVIIVGVAIGHLFSFRGDVIVTEGEAFSSTVSSYNSVIPGPLTNLDQLPPFTIDLQKLDVKFEEQARGAQLGAPREFTAHVQTTEKPGDQPQQQTISPNHPITLDGTEVFLLGNGYAPVVTVKDTKGHVLYSQATPFLAQDNNYTSTGAIKVGSARPKQLAFSGFFLPTAEPTYANGPVSIFPDDQNPELALSIWEGDLYPGGRPQSVYTLNTAQLSQVTKADGSPLLIRLKPGQTFTLPGDRGTISFDSVARWAGLSARVDPGQGLTLAAALLTLLGLLATLLVRRRRVFVRAVAAPDDPSDAPATGPAEALAIRRADGADMHTHSQPSRAGEVSAAGAIPRTVVTIGGLAKNADPGLGTLLIRLRDELT
ncbi:cytochrome c biogenesis protein ResB [Lapillicoccus sp.]|uniref:cytochrome c biogenesis protein ResB n=1 Tax=Lapillicoccus sp. TaxID=1909287 RepID=UPI0025F4A841|nr:cytochrome c biogenesis protein ResB [Lapillicoccus sp.]